MTKDNEQQPLTSALIAQWVVNHRHTDSNPEMLFRIIRNVDQLVVQEMSAAREDERSRVREIVEKELNREKLIAKDQTDPKYRMAHQNKVSASSNILRLIK
jgi:hypothetical protein